MELLWVAFSSSMELLHVDMCKVFNIGDIFPLANSDNLVQTGLQGKLQPCISYCILGRNATNTEVLTCYIITLLRSLFKGDLQTHNIC